MPALLNEPLPPLVIADPQIQIQNVNFAYGTNQTLFDVNMEIERRKVTAFIGPSGCGKSTLLRSINRICDLVENARITQGKILLDGTDINDRNLDVIALRRKVGMVFQKYNPFPRSIY